MSCESTSLSLHSTEESLFHATRAKKDDLSQFAQPVLILYVAYHTSPVGKEGTETCDFEIRARASANGEHARFTKLKSKHAPFCPKRSEANIPSLEKHTKELFSVVQTAKANDLRRAVQLDTGLSISYSTAWKALRHYKGTLQHNGEASFGLIGPLLREFERSNEGTHCDMERATDNTFLRCYLYPGSCAKAFEYCMPLVVLDACHIRSRYGGVIMMASTFDGDNQIVPLGMAICGIETEDNWAFFLRKLKVAIPATNRDGMIFMHDREKGLHEAQKTVFPRSYESICVYHLEKNVKVRFHSALEGLIWSAARAAGHAALESTLKKIEKISSQAAEYLRSSGLEKWTLAKFPAARFGKLTSNAAESMNAWIGDLRDGTPLSIILGWLKKVAVLFYKRRCHWKNETTPIPVHLQNSLRSSGNSAARRGVTQYSDHKYEVGGSSNAAWMVDLHARTCSCHLFQEMKIPCEHAAAVIVSEINMTGTSCKLWEFCDPIYLVSTIARVYASEFTLIDIGTISSDGVTMPNVVPARKGRPKKIRIRSRGEVNPDDQDTCGNCAGRGHNLRTCSRRIEALARAAARREPPRRKVECQLCHGSHYRKTPCRSNP